MPTPTRLILLPGLGADHRLFAEQKPAFADLIVPPWPAAEPGMTGPRRGESLVSFAARVSESLGDLSDAVLGGVSFGGMVAAEITRQRSAAGGLGPRGLILISTCLSPGAISERARAAFRLGRWVPTAILEKTRPPARVLIRQLGPMNAAQRDLLLEMEHAVPLGFIKRAAHAIFSWPGVAREEIVCPVLRVHGDADRIIAAGDHHRGTEAQRGKKAESGRESGAGGEGAGCDVLLRRAGHVACLTHAGEVNEAIARFIARLA
jgi:pimeloyl-ACP methyl ester carboxylesterase